MTHALPDIAEQAAYDAGKTAALNGLTAVDAITPTGYSKRLAWFSGHEDATGRNRGNDEASPSCT